MCAGGFLLVSLVVVWCAGREKKQYTYVQFKVMRSCSTQEIVIECTLQVYNCTGLCMMER